MSTQKVLTLVITPGDGKERIMVDTGTTVGDIIATRGLYDRRVVADGEEVAPDDFNDTVVDDIIELWIMGPTKGA
jgi:hypothetical protein